jgi:transcriptional regulator with XRE-family HTH domain
MKKFKGNKNAYGELIKKYRKQKNFSRNDLSREMDLMGIPMSPDEIYRIESQKLVLKDFELVAICIILNISFDRLQEILK